MILPHYLDSIVSVGALGGSSEHTAALLPALKLPLGAHFGPTTPILTPENQFPGAQPLDLPIVDPKTVVFAEDTTTQTQGIDDSEVKASDVKG